MTNEINNPLMPERWRAIVKKCVPDVTAKERPRVFHVMALVKYSSEIIQYVIVKNAVELGNASARSAVVQAKSKASGRNSKRMRFSRFNG
jgi:hypothetical protein